MAVVINAKGTSVTQFQIGKQGPIIKNNSGVIEFKDSTDTDLQVQILNTASAVNNLTLTGSATGVDPTIAVVGTDTNINIKLEPKGTGEVIIGPTGGSGSSVQAEDDQNLVVKGGDSGGSAAAGDILIEGGNGTGGFASGNVEIRGGTGGSANGLIILGASTGSSVVQGTDDFDITVKGGDSVADNAGDLIIEGGDGTGGFAPGNVVIRGGTGGTGTSFITLDSGVVVGSATGGDQGSGTVNATALHINGNQLPTILTGSNTLDFGSIASLAEADLTITVTGAATGDEVALGLPAAPTSGIVFNAFVSSANTVTVRAHNYTAGAIDPASATYSVRVFQ